MEYPVSQAVKSLGEFLATLWRPPNLPAADTSDALPGWSLIPSTQPPSVCSEYSPGFHCSSRRTSCGRPWYEGPKLATPHPIPRPTGPRETIMYLCATKLREEQATPRCPLSSSSQYRSNSGNPVSDFPRAISSHNSRGHHSLAFWSCAIDVAALSPHKSLLLLSRRVRGRPMTSAAQQAPSVGWKMPGLSCRPP